MTQFLQHSTAFWLLLIVLFVFAAILAAMWSATSRREPLLAAGVAIGLIPLLWIVERLVVTDAEAIEATLHEIAADVKSNNRAAVLGHIHSSARGLRARAEGEIANYEFTECKMNKLHEIVVDAGSSPRSARADFNVYVSGTFKVGNETISGEGFVRRITLHLRQEADGQWKVENYPHTSPLPGRRSADDAEERYGEPRP